MGDEDLSTQFAAIIKEFAAFRVEAAGAKGAFKATGKIGGVVAALLILIGGYAFNKLENQGQRLTRVETEVAVSKVEVKTVKEDVKNNREEIAKVQDRMDILERVVYRE